MRASPKVLVWVRPGLRLAAFQAWNAGRDVKESGFFNGKGAKYP